MVMRIKVASDGRRFTIPIPNCIMFNPISAAILKSYVNRYLAKGNMEVSTAHLSYQEIRKLFKVIKKCRRYLKGDPMIYARSGNGDLVEIYI